MIHTIELPEFDLKIDKTLPRWTSLDEIKIICRFAQRVKGNILEIGTNTGITARDLALSNPSKLIYTVDYTGADITMIEEQVHEQPTKETAGQYIRDLPAVIFMDQKSETIDYRKLIDVQFIFIDGDHSYDMVKKDSEKAIEFLEDVGGIIIWHDYTPDNYIEKCLDDTCSMYDLYNPERTTLVYGKFKPSQYQRIN